MRPSILALAALFTFGAAGFAYAQTHSGCLGAAAAETTASVVLEDRVPASHGASEDTRG